MSSTDSLHAVRTQAAGVHEVEGRQLYVLLFHGSSLISNESRLPVPVFPRKEMRWSGRTVGILPALQQATSYMVEINTCIPSNYVSTFMSGRLKFQSKCMVKLIRSLRTSFYRADVGVRVLGSVQHSTLLPPCGSKALDLLSRMLY